MFPRKPSRQPAQQVRRVFNPWHQAPTVRLRSTNPDTSGSKNVLALCKVCNPNGTDCHWIHCRDLANVRGIVLARLAIPLRGREANPPPRRPSRGVLDVMRGIYAPSGEVFIEETQAGARSLATLIAAGFGVPQIQVREYRGDGRGGWTPVGVETVTVRPTPVASRPNAQSKATNPCMACAGKAAYMPKIG